MNRTADRFHPQLLLCVLRAVAALALAGFLFGAAFGAEPAKPVRPTAATQGVQPGPAARVAIAPPPVAPGNANYAGATEMAPSLPLTIGKSAVVRLPDAAARLSIGNPDVADVLLLSPREIYLLGKKVGTTNVFIWAKGGRTTIMDVVVGLDTGALKSKLSQLVPSESEVDVDSLADSVVLSGRVNDPMKAQRLVSLAEVYSGGRKVVNLLNVEGSQQVMLEVKVAEVSKTLIDRLGAEFNVTRSGDGTAFTLLAQLLTSAAGTLSAVSGSGKTAISLDAEVRKGLVKILAEPTIMAMSGQEGTFLAGGRIFIPVPQTGSLGATSITFEEKEFGVGLRFTPTVLEEGRINLRVTPEVSELSRVGTPVTTLSGQTSVLPSITTRRASTTVQLRDGETFAIGGLINSSVTEAVKAFPILGELPVIGALFRSSEFQRDRSELLFVVTPRLVKPLPPDYTLPTDNYDEPNRREFFLEGRMEGEVKPKARVPPAAPPEANDGGFQLK